MSASVGMWLTIGWLLLVTAAQIAIDVRRDRRKS